MLRKTGGKNALNNYLLSLLMFYVLPVVPKNFLIPKTMFNFCRLRQEGKRPHQVELILGLQKLNFLVRKADVSIS